MKRKIIAILRGIDPSMAAETAHVLLDAGIDMIEVPLNSPDPFKSIKFMVDAHGSRGNFGAGTVLRVDEVDQLALAGGSFVVSPNCDPLVIKKTKAAGLASYPGVFTASECFQALQSGADGLKLFPAEIMGPKGVKALRAVLPADIDLYAVGGAAPSNFAEWVQAGANGFGIGSYIFKPDFSLAQIAESASAIVEAYDGVFGK